MGLKLAVKAHYDGDLRKAETHYKRAFDQKQDSPVYYQNYGALLRSLERIDEAIKLYEQGLRKYPGDLNISTNYANAIRALKPSKALQTYFDIFKHYYFLDPDSQKSSTSFLNLCSQLYDQGYYRWNLELIKTCISEIGLTSGVLQNLLLLADQLSEAGLYGEGSSLESLRSKLENSISSLDDFDVVGIRFALFQHFLHRDNHEVALTQFELANVIIDKLRADPSLNPDVSKKLQASIDVNYWNSSCTLLKLQMFKRGWTMFDYGLRAPCSGPQRWQRSLAKPFTSVELQLWHGENLSGSRLLLLDEQGIGDSMMFLSLIPTLIQEASHIGLFLPDRLISMYKHSFADEIKAGTVSIFSRSDFYGKKLLSSSFDYQSPLGSICRHRFTHPQLFCPRSPVLRCDSILSGKLRAKYFDIDKTKVEKLVGVSWRGGGRSARIKQKSVDVDQFGDLLLDIPGVRFVSLQYGESQTVVDKWRSLGVDILHDETIDPLKDLFSWLAQVRACDAVLSVANTTIHGAGGLNIPTQCLLGLNADWRWLSSDEVCRSYWYNSVGILRQTSEDGWLKALSSAREWLLSGCHLPTGPYFID